MCWLLQLLWLLTRKILQKNKLQLKKTALHYALDMAMLPKGARSCFLKGGGLGRPRQQRVEIRVKPDQSIDLLILVKSAAGVKDATAEAEAEEGD